MPGGISFCAEESVGIGGIVSFIVRIRMGYNTVALSCEWVFATGLPPVPIFIPVSFLVEQYHRAYYVLAEDH
jgi:hypothetical protein